MVFHIFLRDLKFKIWKPPVSSKKFQPIFRWIRRRKSYETWTHDLHFTKKTTAQPLEPPSVPIYLKWIHFLQKKLNHFGPSGNHLLGLFTLLRFCFIIIISCCCPLSLYISIPFINFKAIYQSPFPVLITLLCRSSIPLSCKHALTNTHAHTQTHAHMHKHVHAHMHKHAHTHTH